MNVTLVPNFDEQLKQKHWTDYLDSLHVKYCSLKDLPSKLDGYAIALSNQEYVSGRKIAMDAHSRGLRTVWGSEMMTPFPGEADLLRSGAMDVLIYPSKRCLEHCVSWHNNPSVRKIVVGNYIDESWFPYIHRKNNSSSGLTIGRLSRPDLAKYPEDFPVFYEKMGFRDPSFKVMAWDQKLRDKYSWFSFGPHWELMEAERQGTKAFLSSLDIFLYPIGHSFIESWGRSTVEAMLTGAVPLVPTGHAFEEIFEDGKHGFICPTFESFRERCQWLQGNSRERASMSQAAAKHARSIMDPQRHIATWKEVFSA